MSSTTITTEDVEKFAHLARLRLQKKKLKRIREEFGSILKYVQQISAADTTKVKQKAHVDEINVLRTDSPQTSLSQQEALHNRSDSQKDGYFIIKSVFNND